jgi:hypothetical protein
MECSEARIDLQVQHNQEALTVTVAYVVLTLKAE